MVLTGKCLKDFAGKYPTIPIMPEICEYTLIIEWFDSVGIYISVVPVFKGKLDNIYGYYFSVNHMHNYEYYKLRQEATKQAIIKANQIYNETK